MERAGIPTTNAAFAPDDLRAIAQRMRDLDICMFMTRDGDAVATRPMSNNGQVEFDGDTSVLRERDSAKVRQIEAEPAVGIGHIATERGTWVAMEAEAEIVDDEAEKRERWFETSAAGSPMAPRPRRWCSSAPVRDARPGVGCRRQTRRPTRRLTARSPPLTAGVSRYIVMSRDSA